jgi:prephenate dehydrogenase
MSRGGGTDGPFGRIGIAGLGLIGGSIAKAARRAWPRLEIVAVDRRPVIQSALRDGIVQEYRHAVDALADVELIVLAAPVPAIIKLIERCADARLPGLVTDVGSTKRQIMRSASGRGVSFVGGHPVAGAAYGGLEHARADLFDRRPWLLVAGEGADPAAVDRVEAFVAGLGAMPARTDADTHDRVMAYVSHLPQLIASALMHAAGSAVGIEGLAMSGRGFADMTRLASSPGDVWQGILATNEDYVREALTAFLQALPPIGLVGTSDGAADELFRQANDWLARMRQ